MEKAEKLEKKFGVTSEQLSAWEQEATCGKLPGEPVGKVIVGRPLKFGEPLEFVGFKETSREVAAMDKRASQLGMSRSDYLRSLVREDLARA
jgi:hypothetical protein